MARKKQSIFIGEDAPKIDYKELDTLKGFISDAGKIIPARVTGTGRHHQKQLSMAIKHARYLALLPYTDKH